MTFQDDNRVVVSPRRRGGMEMRRARAPAAAWTPAVLSPLIWLDATRLGLSDGASVSSWTDMSGNSNHFVQANGTKQPVFRTSGINGQAAVEGDGVDDTLGLASVASASAWWQMTVGQLVSWSTLSNAWAIDDYEPDGVYILMQLNGANDLVVNNSSGPLSPGSMPAGTGTPRGYLFQGSTSGATLEVDDGTTAISGANFTKAMAGMRLFARLGDGLYTHYRIGEFLYGTGVLTTEQMAALWGYVSNKWGVGDPS